MARERYIDQVRLLVDILPAVAAEEDFALKGGTAINLFYRDLPRLSVDVDLTFLPVRDRAQSLADIDDAIDRIAKAGSKVRGVTSSRKWWGESWERIGSFWGLKQGQKSPKKHPKMTHPLDRKSPA